MFVPGRTSASLHRVSRHRRIADARRRGDQRVRINGTGHAEVEHFSPVKAKEQLRIALVVEDPSVAPVADWAPRCATVKRLRCSSTRSRRCSRRGGNRVDSAGADAARQASGRKQRSLVGSACAGGFM